MKLRRYLFVHLTTEIRNMNGISYIPHENLKRKYCDQNIIQNYEQYKRF